MVNPTAPVPYLVERGPAPWARLASLGFLMAAVAPLLFLLSSLLWGMSVEDDLGFFLVTAALGVGAAALVRQRRTVLKIIGIVLGLLVGMALFWTAFGITAPASFFDFLPAFLVIPGVLLGLVAGIASVRAARQPGARRGTGEARALRLIPAVLGVLAVVSIVLTITGRDTVSDEEAAGADVVVELSDFEFDRESYDVAGGSTVLVKNSDPLQHTFTIDALDVDVTLTPGSEKLVTIPADPGEYVLYCVPHTEDSDEPGDSDMAATITVD